MESATGTNRISSKLANGESSDPRLRGNTTGKLPTLLRRAGSHEH